MLSTVMAVSQGEHGGRNGDLPAYQLHIFTFNRTLQQNLLLSLDRKTMNP
jgi:hypothetical protein